MMVDDNDVTLHPTTSHFGDEAALPFAALLSDAGFCSRIQFVPESARLRKLGEFGSIACACCLFPRSDGPILFDLFKSAQHRLISEVVEFLAAQIIVTAFHVADGKPAGALSRLGPAKQSVLKKWDIFIEKLLLQILGARRDDYALARSNHRHQIRQGFACPGAGLHNQVALFLQCLLDGLCHLQLPAPKFIRGMSARKHSARTEE